MDYVDDYLFDGDFILLGEDGTVVTEKGKPVLQQIHGKSWVNNHAHVITADNQIDFHFLYYLLMDTDVRAIVTGAVQPKISQANLKTVMVSVPDLQTQRKIAAVLSALDDKIENNRRICKTLEEMAQAIFKSWFVDFEPFCGTVVENDVWGRHPEDLPYVQVRDIDSILETGSRPKGGASASGVPSIGAENVKELGVVDFNAAKFIPVDYAAKMKRGRINGYELLLYKDGGKPGTFTPHFSMFGEGFPYKECFINEHVFKLDLGSPSANVFAYFYFQTPNVFHWLATNGSKAAIPGINQANVLEIQMPDPANVHVKRFGELVLPSFRLIFEKCKESRALASMRDALLPKLMSGEIDVEGVAV